MRALTGALQAGPDQRRREIAGSARSCVAVQLADGEAVPSTCSITPGATSRVAGQTTQPMTRSDVDAAPRSRRPDRRVSSRVPVQAPPCPLEYHQGMPFCAVTTAVSGPSAAASAARSPARVRLDVRKTRRPRRRRHVVGAVRVGDDLAAALALDTRTPFARIAASCAPRAISVTSAPDAASFAPR